MSDLDLIHQLEAIIENKLEEVTEERFKITPKNITEDNIVEEDAYALSRDANILALFLKGYDASQPFPFSDFKQLKYLYLMDLVSFNFLFLKGLTNLQALALSCNELSELSFLEEVEGLQTLVLAGDHLSDVSCLKELKGLQTLVLAGDHLSDVSCLKELKGLQTLVLAGDHLSDVSFLKELRGLTYLNLESNQLSDVSFLKELRGLTYLGLKSNQLSDVSFLKELRGLTYLDLKSTQLSDVSFLKELRGLTSLNLESTQLSDVSFLKELRGLTYLNLGSNQLSDVSFLKELRGLTYLDLGFTQLSDVSILKELKGLTSLNLGSNQLSNVSILKELRGLTSLNLESTQLSDVSFLKELRGLTSLNLRSNQLRNVSILKELRGLTSLDLSFNQLSNVSFLKELRGLTSLNLEANQLSDVSFLKELKGLTSINLRSNRIYEVPAWLAEKGLAIQVERESYVSKSIALHENPIEKPPLEVAKQGNKAIVNYYHQIETQGKDYLYEAKMLIVGEGGAGKTTLAHKMQHADCPLPQIDDRTKGITINSHIFEARPKNNSKNLSFRLNVWDFGGQEIYHATHRFFLSKRSLYVLVADNRKDDTDFNYWLNVIELFAGESPMIIVLNEKDDLHRSVNLSELFGRYPQSIKEVVSVNFKTLEENDQDIRRRRLWELAKLIRDIEHYAEGLPHIGEPVPARWVEARQAVEKESRNYIYREQFEEICRKQEITDAQDITTLLGYFHDLGIVLNFANSPMLRNWVILRPAWATNAVYRIFDNATIKAKQGRFTRDDCAALWSDEQYHNMQDILIELMKNFRLVYEISNSGNLVAPQLLPENTPDFDWDAGNNILMQFRYDTFMPKGIFGQFVVMMYRYIEDHRWVWRNGVILQRNGAKAEVIENLFERRIYIRFSGRGIAEFRAIIADTLDEISQSYHKLKYEKMIPCNCHMCKDVKEPTFYEFTDLKTRREKGKLTVECKKSYEDVPVQLLVEGFKIRVIEKDFADKMKKVEPKQETKMQTVRIFLASSSELKKDREQFEVFINRKNKEYMKAKVFLHLTMWEDFLDAISETRLQDEYNKAIANCDVFVSLFHTKVGKYTEEEFLTALDSLKKSSRPLIYTYFRDTPISMSEITPDILTLLNFKKKLGELGHFPTVYADINDLKYKFNEQLIKFMPRLTGISQSIIEQHSEP